MLELLRLAINGYFRVPAYSILMYSGQIILFYVTLLIQLYLLHMNLKCLIPDLSRYFANKSFLANIFVKFFKNI